MNQVVIIKARQFTMVKNNAAVEEIVPAGISRVCVRGFRASISLSAHLLKAIALVLAKTMHSTTFKASAQVREEGCWLMARKNPINANGRAKIVCENFTKDR